MDRIALSFMLLKRFREMFGEEHYAYIGGSTAANYCHNAVHIEPNSDIDLFILGSPKESDLWLSDLFDGLVITGVTELDISPYALLPNQWGRYKVDVEGFTVDIICLDTSISNLISKTASDLGKIYLTLVGGSTDATLKPVIGSIPSLINLENKKVYLNTQQATYKHMEKVTFRTVVKMGYEIIHSQPEFTVPPKLKMRPQKRVYDDERII